MIDEIDLRLKEWIATVIDSSFQISFEHPGITNKKPTVSAYLYGLDNSMPSSATRNTPFQITLSYLLTVLSDNQIESHHNLGKLLFAAKERKDLDVEFTSLPAGYWQSFGTVPLPYFILHFPLQKTRHVEQTPIITKSPSIEMGSIYLIEGVLLGLNNQPISAAKIMLDSTKSIAYTDSKGSFSIAAGSISLKQFKCIISTKGKQFSISVPMQKNKETPITIHLDTKEV